MSGWLVAVRAGPGALRKGLEGARSSAGRAATVSCVASCAGPGSRAASRLRSCAQLEGLADGPKSLLPGAAGPPHGSAPREVPAAGAVSFRLSGSKTRPRVLTLAFTRPAGIR